MKKCLVLVLFFVISIYSINSFACDACNKSTVKKYAVASAAYSANLSDTRTREQRVKDSGMIPGEYMFSSEINPAPRINNLKPNQVHRCGQISSKEILDCKCGALVHTWIPVSSAQYNATPQQLAALKEKNIRNAQISKSKNLSNVNNIKTAVQNYKQ